MKNKKYGYLILTGKEKKVQAKKQKIKMVQAICSCGKKKYFFYYNILNGRSKSCCRYNLLKRYEFKGKFLTSPEIFKIMKYGRWSIYARNKSGIPLDWPYRKKYHLVDLLKPNSMAGLARRVGISRERVRQLKLKGLSDKAILKRYDISG